MEEPFKICCATDTGETDLYKFGYTLILKPYFCGGSLRLHRRDIELSLCRIRGKKLGSITVLKPFRCNALRHTSQPVFYPSLTNW
jgi:hypothetical protein